VRVLQLAPVWETVPPPAYGGTETVVHLLAEELTRRGVEVTLCASGDSVTSAKLFSVVPQSLRAADLCEDALQYGLMHAALSLRQARDYDLIHCHSGPPAEFGMALSHLVDVPMLMTLHNHLSQSERLIWSSYRGWYNTISHHQHLHSPALPLAQFAGVVHNAIDVDSFPFETEKDDYLLFMGRLVPEKGPHLAAEVARRLGSRLVIAGKVAAPEEREFFDTVMRPLIDDNVVCFVGEANGRQKRELYRKARCLLLPLLWDEPFGLVMIEAMACGTPPIVFPRGAAPEIIENGRTGFLVNDVVEMAEAVRRVREIDPSRCREAVQDRFSPAVLAERYMAIYRRILGDAAPEGSAYND